MYVALICFRDLSVGLFHWEGSVFLLLLFLLYKKIVCGVLRCVKLRLETARRRLAYRFNGC